MIEISLIDSEALKISLSDNMQQYLKHAALSEFIADIETPCEDVYLAYASFFNWLMYMHLHYKTIQEMQKAYFSHYKTNLAFLSEFQDIPPSKLAENVCESYSGLYEIALSVLAIQNIESKN